MSSEREVEHLRQQLMSGGTSDGSFRQTEVMQQSVPDMEHAIDILKRSSLEVELAGKEKEVGRATLITRLDYSGHIN